MPTHTTAELARRLRAALAVEAEPVALTFTEADPEPDRRPPAPVAAGCCFWAPAERTAIATSAADHAGCSVGAYTHGFLGLEAAAAGADTAALLGAGWVTEADLLATPAVAPGPGGVLYAPLTAVEEPPDVVLVRVPAEGAMRVHDAVPEMLVTGKPQCQIVPRARERGEVVASLGCAVSRARTGMAADQMTIALPGARLAEVVERLEVAVAADRVVADYARGGGEPAPHGPERVVDALGT
jgi:uncharacterized protein (DUF169 family)